ncbi:hypothetical protein [Streptomyces sp. SID3343]|uniref:hypothetical protein n=1 Tax=Streptomyces sp. SID3343 TaxID=2690260 RepID=UPI001371044F|nr:hypothetical protein [Streptomyces sp. SID3343]MYW03925.1 hypothetical protein [Streptomyces sp. SID3343]
MTAKFRRATVVAVAAGFVLSAGAAAPALAASAGSPPAVVQVQQADVVQHVTQFFDQYKSAVEGTNPDMNPQEVRNEFLTPELNARLDAWADQNMADPVFRAQNVPQDRSVRYEGSGAGHATVVVTEYWGDGSSTDVWYQVPLAGGRITDLIDAPQ